MLSTGSVRRWICSAFVSPRPSRYLTGMLFRPRYCWLVVALLRLSPVAHRPRSGRRSPCASLMCCGRRVPSIAASSSRHSPAQASSRGHSTAPSIVSCGAAWSTSAARGSLLWSRSSRQSPVTTVRSPGRDRRFRRPDQMGLPAPSMPALSRTGYTPEVRSTLSRVLTWVLQARWRTEFPTRTTHALSPPVCTMRWLAELPVLEVLCCVILPPRACQRPRLTARCPAFADAAS